MSVRSDKAPAGAALTSADAMTAAIANSLPNDLQLHEGSSYATASAENPLHRKIAVTLHTNLHDLCLQASKATWEPSADALKSIMQHRKFTDLSGSSQSQGDLSSVVMHDMTLLSTSSTFSLALGARITGVDDHTYSSTGEAFSAILPPKAANTTPRKLQSDDTSLSYEFATKFPGYTSANLGERGVHEVAQRRFVLLSVDHPVVAAISENSDSLQTGEISMMPEGLVKISSSLYESILPSVRSQVESQLRVRDFSNASVTFSPADYSTWEEAKNALVMSAKREGKAAHLAEMRATDDAVEKSALEAEWKKKEASIEHSVTFDPISVSMELGIDYNFLAA